MNFTGIMATDQLMNVTMPVMMSTAAPEAEAEAEVTTAIPDNAPLFILKKITGDIPEFEIILPCIFGIFIMLSLSLMVFYTKGTGDNKAKIIEMQSKHDSSGDGKKKDSAWF